MIKCIEIKENGLDWIIEDQFLYLAHVNLHHRTNTAHLGNLEASLGRDSAPRLKFTEVFDIKILGEINHHLNMKITRSQDGIKIYQTTNANDVVTRFKRYLMSNLNKKYNTPMEREFKIEERLLTEAQRKYAEKFLYQNVIGVLLYLAINTRLDLLYRLGVLARH